MSLSGQEILIMGGGHVVIDDTTAYDDYRFAGFIPHEDTTFTTLKIGSTDVTPTGKTYKPGIFYGAPRSIGYYDYIKLATGAVVLVLAPDSVTKY